MLCGKQTIECNLTSPCCRCTWITPRCSRILFSCTCSNSNSKIICQVWIPPIHPNLFPMWILALVSRTRSARQILIFIAAAAASPRVPPSGPTLYQPAPQFSMKFSAIASSSKQASFPKKFQHETSRTRTGPPTSKDINDLLAPPHAKRKIRHLVSQLYMDESLALEAEEVCYIIKPKVL